MSRVDGWNAFVQLESPDLFDLPCNSEGCLKDLRFAVKDVYDIEGYTAGAGNPDWKRTHEAAEENAPVINMLLEQGARLIGRAHTDELMFGLNGENEHYGTPVNPRAGGRIPGGSSSGSAVAVASGMADFAMGTDTAGSIRVPASYCGIYGMRPTYGRISMQGIVPLAPAVDTAGWMASSLSVLKRVGEVLLAERRQEPEQVQKSERMRKLERPAPTMKRLVWPVDMWALLDSEVKLSSEADLHKLRSSVDVVHEESVLAEEGLDQWLQAFRLIQGFDIWRTHGEWIERVQPTFAPDVAARFQWSSTVREEDVREARKLKALIEARMAAWLGDDTVLIVPTTPGIAPPLGQTGEAAELRRSKTLQLCCPAGLAGLPQVTVPWLAHDGIPVGLSFIAGAGQDLNLLRFVASVAEAIGMPVEVESK